MAEHSIPVDLYNPGQVFACLGFIEAAAVKMECQCIRCELEGARNVPRRHAFGSCLHKQAKHIETIVLGESGQCR